MIDKNNYTVTFKIYDLEKFKITINRLLDLHCDRCAAINSLGAHPCALGWGNKFEECEQSKSEAQND